MIYYTSDTHFRHKNIIKYCNRPFASIDEHDEAIIARWNETVSPDDIVYHLGDFIFGDKAEYYLSSLNGKKHLIWGNHDSTGTKNATGWESSQPYLEIKDGNHNVVLFHYACRVWNASHHGSFHLWGHSHGGLSHQGRSLDVGVDSWDYRPVTIFQVKDRLAELGSLDDYGIQKKR